MSNLEFQRPSTDVKSDGKSAAPNGSDVWSEIANLQQKEGWSSAAKSKTDAPALSKNLVDQGVLPAFELITDDRNDTVKQSKGSTDKTAETSQADGKLLQPNDGGSSRNSDGASNNAAFAHQRGMSWAGAFAYDISLNDPLAVSDHFNCPADGVEQGAYGDCFFESALASVAASPGGQQKIQDMIKMNNDGSFTVTFPGDKDHPVTVTDADLIKYNTSNDGDWANIIETAFLKLDKAKVNGGDSAIDFSRAPVHSSAMALQLLTGDETFVAGTQGVFGLSKVDMQNVIEQALRDGEPITASSDYVPKGDGIAGSDGIYYPAPGSNWPIVGNHQFSVIGYDPKTQTVTLRNPWGSDGQGGKLTQPGQTVDGMTDEGMGKLSMSLSTFDKHFCFLDYATKPDDDTAIWNSYVAD
jgi:hypothetical protein